MTHEHLDSLLASADPIAPGALSDVADDARARADRTRITAQPRSPRSGPRRAMRAGVAVAGVVALVALGIALIVAVPGDGDDVAGPVSGLSLTPSEERPAARRGTFRFLDAGELHGVGWNLVAPGLGQVAGRPAVVVSAGPACVGCGPLVRAVEELWRTRAVGDLVVLGVADEPSDISWWRGLGTTFPIAGGGAPLERSGLVGGPALLLIDRAGRIAAAVEGTVSRGDLGVAVDSLLAETAPSVPAEPLLIPGPVPPSAVDLGVFAAATPVPVSAMPDPVRRALAGAGAYAESVRIALRTPSGRRAWVARARGDTFVLANEGPDQIVSASADISPDVIRNGGIFSRGRDLPSEPYHLVGLVPDRYVSMRHAGVTTPITNNVFIVESRSPIGTVTLEGPAGRLVVP